MSYSPVLGRFIQRDPLGYVDGGSLYEYVRSGPVGAVDPPGRNTAIIGGSAGQTMQSGAIAIGSKIPGIGGAAVRVAAGVAWWIDYDAQYNWDRQYNQFRKPLVCESSNPFKGQPGSIADLRRPDGSQKQTRRYGSDGYPEVDVDHDHNHGQGQPHAHDWGRPAGGGPPRAQDRSPGRPVSKSDP